MIIAGLIVHICMKQGKISQIIGWSTAALNAKRVVGHIVTKRYVLQIV